MDEFEQMNMDVRPLVSIITPTYNHERFIGSCIGSVREQSYPNWELIIVDDASTDRTADIIGESSVSEGRIKVMHHEKNWGVDRLGETYNQALAAARGEFIAILEGDDFWPHDKLEKQVGLFLDEDVVLVWGRAGFTDESGRMLGYRPRKPFAEETASNDPLGRILKEMLARNIIPPVSVLIRRSALMRIGGFKHHYGFVDYPTFLEMSLLGKFAYTQSVTGFWRRHPAQCTAQEVEQFALAASRYAQDFTNRIPETIRSRHSISAASIRKLENKRVMFAFLFEARASLARSDWPAARASLKRASARASFLWKIVINLGYFVTIRPLRYMLNTRK